MITQFFNSFDYVVQKKKDLENFNFLAVVREPSETKRELDTEFDESFLPKDLNKFGLVTA